MNRVRLPDRRAALTLQLEHGGFDVVATVGFFDAPGVRVGMGGGPPAEVFVQVAEAGTPVRHAASDAAILVSLALQGGIDLPTIHHALSRDERERPASIIAAVVEKMMEIDFSGKAITDE